MPPSSLILLLLFLSFTFPAVTAQHHRGPHSIRFRHAGLRPSSLAWDPHAQHFLAASSAHAELASVSDAAVSETLILDAQAPPFLAVAVDSASSARRILAATPSALVAYSLTPSPTLLHHAPLAFRPAAVAVDHEGTAYVTDADANRVWKVTKEGNVTLLSASKAFADAAGGREGLDCVVYDNKGYLLVVQGSSGRLFKVQLEEGGAAREVPLPGEGLRGAEGLAKRRDGVVVAVGPETAWFLKSDDGWGRGAVFDRVGLGGGAAAVAVAGERVCVLYGEGEEWYRIEEIRAPSEEEEERVWVYLLIGLGMAYFMFWRFQMGQLSKNMNKKRA